MKLTNLNCPQCNGLLNQERDMFFCSSCGSAFAVDYDENDVRYTQLVTEADRTKMLLAKDIKSVTGVVSRYFGQEGFDSLPVPVQEAVLFYSEYTRNVDGADALGPEWCAAHGVTEGTFRRFQKFQDESLKSGGKAPKGYNSSYWYYLLYKQI